MVLDGHLLVKVLAATEGEAAEGGVAVLGVNLTSFLLQLATFLLVFFILKKYAFGPILKALEERRKTIEESLKTAAKLEKQQAELAAKTERTLKQARQDAEAVINKAHTEAGSIVQAAEDRASAKSDQIIKDARLQINEEVKSAKHTLKRETMALVVEATESILEEKLDSRKDHQLIERALSRSEHE